MHKGEEISSKSTIAMGGNSLCNEPTKFQVTEWVRTILQQSSWISYLNRLQGFNTEIEIEFLQNLREGHTIVKGRVIPVSEEVIAELSEIPMEGKKWTNKHFLIEEEALVYQDPHEQLIQKGKGIYPASLRQP